MTAERCVRTSTVEELFVRDVTLGSIVKAGDTSRLAATSLALAVQRQVETFRSREGDDLLSRHPAFTEPIPVPLPGREGAMHIRNRSPRITVGCIDVTSVSSSSLLHIGCVKRLTLESRVLNIRHLIPGAVPQVDVQTQ